MRKSLLLAGIILIAFSLHITAGVMFQGFYWNAWDSGESWWKHLARRANELKLAGFDAIWIPPALKTGSGGYSMGYDPFDHYDIGSKDLGGGPQTHWGTAHDLRQMVAMARANGLNVFADMVLNHLNSTDGSQNFNYKNWAGTVGAGRFPKSHLDFHNHWDDGPWDDTSFYNDINYYNGGYMLNGVKDFGDWFTKTTGITGYRFDYVKGLPFQESASPKWWFISQFLNHGAMTGKYAVSEFADDNRDTLNWYIANTGNRTSCFDFSLRAQLEQLCNGTGSYNFGNLSGAGLVAINPGGAVTFVENHDTDSSKGSHFLRPPIISNKILAYAYILTHEGYPCVFYKDYYDYGMKGEINNLIWCHEKLAGGSTTVKHASHDCYVMQRNGWGSNPGLVLILNRSTSWRGQWIPSKWNNTTLHCYAWGSTSGSTSQPADKYTQSNGWVQVWAPPRGYAVYAPAGYSGGFSAPQWPVTQEFWGADDLAIAPVTGTANREVGQIYVQNGKSISITLYTDKTGWGSSSYVRFRLYRPDNTVAATKTVYKTTGTATLSHTANQTGTWTIKQQAYSMPASVKSPFWAVATYTAPQTIPLVLRMMTYPSFSTISPLYPIKKVYPIR